jgi:hypothetical protein
METELRLPPNRVMMPAMAIAFGLAFAFLLARNGDLPADAVGLLVGVVIPSALFGVIWTLAYRRLSTWWLRRVQRQS